MSNKKKKMFYVSVREVHVAIHEVEAESAEAAMQAVKDGESSLIDLEFSRTLDPDTWTVEEGESHE